MRTIGINLNAIKGLSDDEYLKLAAEAGFSATFSGVYDIERHLAIAASCKKYGIAYETLHAPFNHINDIWLENDNGLLDELKYSVDCCAATEIPILVVHLSSGMNPPSITDIGRARFAELVAYAAEKQVKIAFENQRTLANLAWSFEAFKNETVGFCWDCGHESCFTPGRHFMPLFGDRLICTHIHDNSAIFNHDDHLLPFDGAADFDYVAKTIGESSYTGSLMLEIGNDAVYGGMDPKEFLEKAAAAAKKLRAMADGERL